MNEEERRRCCILGGCGCTPGGAEQLAALVEELELARTPEKAAKKLLEIFGAGPHRDRLRDLDLPQREDKQRGEGL